MNKEMLSQFEEFVKTALAEIADLKSQLSEIEEKRAALEETRDEEYEHAVKQAAEALYAADYISDDYDRRKFIKKAKENHGYLAQVIEKLCKAAEVSSFGEVANVKSAGDIQDDPVMRKAFGYDNNYNLLDDEN